MFTYSLGHIGEILDAELVGDSHKTISSVSIDSRSVSLNRDTLFFAIAGSNHDGHRFIDELYKRGVKSFVVNRDGIANQYPDASFLRVDNTLDALQQLAQYHRHRFQYPVIGITGSNGKTIVKEWISQLLACDSKIIRSPKSFNSQVGVPLSVLLMEPNSDLAIFEAGISMAGEMERLERIISPEIGILTNLGTAHQENFNNLAVKGHEKMKLFAHAKVLIYCAEHQLIHSMAVEEEKKRLLKRFTWSRKTGADVVLNQVDTSPNRAMIKALYGDKAISFSIPFSDNASVENAMHCLCVLLYLGIDIDSIPERMNRLLPVAMRLELKEGINGCTLINDSYNSDVGSLSVALDFLAQQKQHARKMIILSDILQSGRDPLLLYSEVAELVKSWSIDLFIGVGKELQKYSHLFGEGSRFFATTGDFLNSFSRSDISNTAILIKGSRPFRFEEISRVLEQKTHRTIMENNLNAMVHNLNYFRGLLKPGVKTMAMVKAFSYGSGSYEIANLLQFHRVDYLGVAFADEGVALREAGITLPIVVLNPAFGSYDLMIDYELEPELFSFNSLDSFALSLSKRGFKEYPVHIKIDTGMHRLGFMEKETAILIDKLVQTPMLKVQSIFSHLVASEDPEHDDFTRKQIEGFSMIGETVSRAIGYKPMLHILNSAGIERFPNAQFDMVRLGIGLYGVSVLHQSELLNVSTLKTFVAQIHTLAAGETVGYNRMGKLTRPSRIATLPIGYADGLSRRLSNGVGSVLVGNCLAPIIGNVSMDTCMIDVTDIPNIEEGDEVILFGENPTIFQVAQAMGTIPYEVLTSISRRVKRVYIRE